MCDYGYSDRQYWIRHVEEFRRQVELEELERQRKAASRAKPEAKPETGAAEPEPLPV